MSNAQHRFEIPAIFLLLLMTGCSNGSEDASRWEATPDLIAMIEEATPIQITPEQVAEAFALGSNSTDLQREHIEESLVGHVVEWNLEVYEIARADGLYKITSQPFPIKSAHAAPLIRTVAFVHALDDKDRGTLADAQTGDVLSIRGLVRAIEFRTVVVIGPAVLAARL